MENLELIKYILESAEEFNKTIKTKVRSIRIFDGRYRWILDDESISGLISERVFDGYPDEGAERSLVDLEHILDLEEKLLSVRAETLEEVLSLKVSITSTGIPVWIRVEDVLKLKEGDE